MNLDVNALADLSPLFTWNTKQLFVSLEAEYENIKGVRVYGSNIRFAANDISG